MNALIVWPLNDPGPASSAASKDLDARAVARRTPEQGATDDSHSDAMVESIDGLGQLMAEAAAVMDLASRELEAAGIDLEEEEDRGPQVINEEQETEAWSTSDRHDPAKERLLLQAELAEVKSLQQANLERMEARLANIENLVEELGLGRAQDLSIEAALEEIRGNVVVSESRRDMLATSMSMIGESVQDLRTSLSATNKMSLATAKRVQQLSEKLAKSSPVHSSRSSSTSGRPKVAPVLVLGVGILVLTWTLAFYLKTGNFYVAIAGVVLTNLSACATILLGRTESE